ncbi:YfgM family protein [Marinobacterium rhizophilum]|uniref:Ancillary SecYEG translocon subunit n=1 Tax=Marinobacterium rhizophilum TaxID=420402 RepID=A0ABY5HTD9_9GAMM|nr:tetratricopeptide repeat protein [Marinobacterium rhizophilum]UTW14477.1 tetratricopeptide repeat protein [Marinobacterium rhizophilum]
MRTEEEQVEALKRWWQENGKTLLLTLAVALALVFGWRTWQDRQAADAANASALYQNLVQSVTLALGAEGTDAQVATAEHLATSLKTEHEDSAYAALGSLLMARVAVEQGQLDEALAELEWVLSHEPGDAQRIVATLRKAQVLGEQGQAADALKLLDALDPGSFEASYQELRGDLLLGEGKAAEARDAYRLAAEAAEATGVRPLLTMKLENLTAEEG